MYIRTDRASFKKFHLIYKLYVKYDLTFMGKYIDL